MLGILFLFFCHYLQESDFQKLFLVLLCLLWMELDKNLSFGGLFFYFLFLYFVIYLPLMYLFSKAVYMKIFYVCLVYCGFGILYSLFFASDYVDFGDLLMLLGLYMLGEGVMVLLHEFKN